MYAPPLIKKIWIISFEFGGVAKVGGLGEAVSLLGRELVKRGLDVTVIMPSHGVYPQGFNELYIECCNNRYGVDGNTYPYDIGFLEGYIDGVRIIIVKGRSQRTSMVLDVWPPYSYVEEKACLLTRAVKCLTQVYGYPDIVHANDWHSVMAAVFLKLSAELNGYSLPLLYQIHLRGSPSYPWHYASEAWCGLPNVSQRVWAVYKHIYEYTQALWDRCWGNIECFMIILADAIAGVSKSEIDGLARDYGGWVKDKSCHSYNSTLWSVKEVEEYALKRYGSSKRNEIRWRVVEDLLRNRYVWGYLDLRESDVLVVSSGRLTSQKGFDILLHAAKLLPNQVKIIILGRGVGDNGYEAYLRHLIGEAYGKATLITDWIDEPVIKLLTYVSHVYTLISRYEPFGISGIEALAVGTPIVVSNVGGLSEYVSDIRITPLGVGLKISLDNIFEIAYAIQSLGYLMHYAETGQGLDRIVFRELRDIAMREPKYGEKLRNIAIAYVDTYFRPNHAVNNILACYELARQMAYYRAHA